MYINSYKFTISHRQDVKSTLNDRFNAVGNANGKNYDETVDWFESIKKADIHILDNKNVQIESRQALELAYAMTLNKPIIILHPPQFAYDTNRFLKEIILANLSKIMLCDLTMLDDTDVQYFINNLINQAPNYSLTKHATTLIESQRRALFRELLLTMT